MICSFRFHRNDRRQDERDDLTVNTSVSTRLALFSLAFNVLKLYLIHTYVVYRLWLVLFINVVIFVFLSALCRRC